MLSTIASSSSQVWCSMLTTEWKPTRSWREVAQLVLQEQDHDTALELAEELIRALGAGTMCRMEEISAKEKTSKTA
jgi:hypothetical protein